MTSWVEFIATLQIILKDIYHKADAGTEKRFEVTEDNNIPAKYLEDFKQKFMLELMKYKTKIEVMIPIAEDEQIGTLEDIIEYFQNKAYHIGFMDEAHFAAWLDRELAGKMKQIIHKRMNKLWGKP